MRLFADEGVDAPVGARLRGDGHGQGECSGAVMVLEAGGIRIRRSLDVRGDDPAVER